jgi:hypothetical protein
MPAPTLTFTPQTELDAVNQMLLSIGQAPINTLATSGITDANVAHLILHNTSREVQSRGWNFNTDNDWPLTPDVNSKIAVPGNALAVDPEDQSLDYVQRVDPADASMRLWDRKNLTFVIASPVKCEITWFFPFENLPQAARAYIATKAGRIFQAQSVGSQILYQYTKERELECLGELNRAEAASEDNNAFTADPNTAYIAWRDRVY